MGTWTTNTTVPGGPVEVLEFLTTPDAIRRWAPVPFEIRRLAGDRLITGSRARVAGRLGGKAVEFDVEVFDADDGHLALAADGPISIDVEYRLRPVAAGSELNASISVSGRGFVGRVLARATDALLAAGALDSAVGRIAQEFEPAATAA